MKKKQILVLSLLFYSIAVFSQKKCDCTITPFKPDSCRSICLGILLQQADTTELSLILGLNDTLTNKVVNWRKIAKAPDLSSLQNYLNTKDFKAINESLNKLNAKQLEYFISPLDKRKEFIKEWKNLKDNERNK